MNEIQAWQNTSVNGEISTSSRIQNLSPPSILWPPALQNPSNVPGPDVESLSQAWGPSAASGSPGMAAGQSVEIALQTLDLQDLGFQEMLLAKDTEDGLVDFGG